MEAMVKKIEDHVKALQETLDKQSTRVTELERERSIAIADIQKINGAIIAYQDSINLMKGSSEPTSAVIEPEVVEGEVV